MGFFSSIGNIPTSAFSSAIFDSTTTKAEMLRDQALTKKIDAAKQEIENFSLEPDESFFNDTTNKLKD